MLRDYVINHQGHEGDSALGLAARICELCIRLEELPKLGAPARMTNAEAYSLGRLLTLANVYEVQGQDAVNAGEASGRARRGDGSMAKKIRTEAARYITEGHAPLRNDLASSLLAELKSTGVITLRKCCGTVEPDAIAPLF